MMSPTVRRLIRSYALLIVLAIGFIALAMFVREKPKVVPANVIETGRVVVVHR